MKSRTIVLGTLQRREAAALLVDGKLDDLLIDADAPAPGTVYRARVDRPVKGQGGVFVQTPDGPGFLRQVKGLSPGAMLLVQVTGYAEAGKAVPVTVRLLFKSRFVIVTPDAPGVNLSRAVRDEAERDRILEAASGQPLDEGFGLILRSACAGAPSDDIADDIAATYELARKVTEDAGDTVEKLVEGDGPHDIAWREWSTDAEVDRTENGFEHHGVTDAIDGLGDPAERLPGGGTFYVERTRALISVDVNTGGDTSPAAGLKANLACARALPRALRLRGLGGQIVIDPAPMPKKDRRAFETALRAGFRADPEETALVGWTALGLFELQRKRGRVPLADILA